MKARKTTIIKKQVKATTGQLEDQIKDLVALQFEVANLPPLSDVEKAKFDQVLAIDQLYYSSKLEGSELTGAMIDQAIHGKKLPAA
jgi:hypothetical protein